MRIFRYPRKPDGSGPVAAAIGNFDGVHAGHQAIIEKVVAESRKLPGGRSMLVTFYPHPAVVLGKAGRIPQITTLRDKVAVLKEPGLDLIYLIHFTPGFSAIPARDFIRDILIRDLNIAHLIIGPDARVGKGAEGDAESISAEFKNAGRTAEVLPFVDNGQVRISSRLVRQYADTGDLTALKTALRRDFSISGRVIRGAGRGAKIGFPTANIAPRSGQQLVPDGVYITRADIGDRSYPAVSNLGVRPTFGGGRRLLETHLLDYQGPQFYSEVIRVHFLQRIRGEMKFGSAEELVSQIGLDREKAGEFFRKG